MIGRRPGLAGRGIIGRSLRPNAGSGGQLETPP
jgi:hypothetical protein